MTVPAVFFENLPSMSADFCKIPPSMRDFCLKQNSGLIGLLGGQYFRNRRKEKGRNMKFIEVWGLKTCIFSKFEVTLWVIEK